MVPTEQTLGERLDRAADTAREWMERGNARRIVIRAPGGDALLQLPLPIGLAVGFLLAVTLPGLSLLAAVIALIAGCRFQVVRRVPPLLPDDDRGRRS